MKHRVAGRKLGLHEGARCAVIGPHPLRDLGLVFALVDDLLIVDRMIPGLDGLNLVRSLRAAGHHTPVLFLTALGGVFYWSTGQ